LTRTEASVDQALRLQVSLPDPKTSATGFHSELSYHCTLYLKARFITLHSPRHNHTNTHTHTQTHTHTHTHTHTQTQTHTHTHKYTHIHTHTHTHTITHTYIHTHTYTHFQSCIFPLRFQHCSLLVCAIRLANPYF
jgi:hypothetical protein